MTLNKEKILNELGDVMSQLQSADCGCMENLFTPSPVQAMAAVPGMRGCCGHLGCYGGQPTQAMPVPTNASQVMGNCNPAQLYNETCNYLSEHLVKPVVQEVYQDLKSLTPENTMANNPLAQQIIGGNVNSGALPSNAGMPMGQGNLAISNPDMSVVKHMGGMLQNQMMGGGGGQCGMAGQMGQNQIMRNGGYQPISEHAKRTGEDWVNMMMGDCKNNPTPAIPDKPGMPDVLGMPDMSDMNALTSGMPQMGGCTSANGISAMVGGTPPITGGATQITAPSMPHINNPNTGQPQNHQDHPLANMSQMAGMVQMPQNMYQNMQQPHRNQYEIDKFNKMFPEIKQGGDLGFDPMALAMQMNPSNQKQASIEAHGLATAPKTHASSNPQYFNDEINSNCKNIRDQNYNNYNNDINNNNNIKVDDINSSKVPPSIMGVRNGLMPQDQVNYNTWIHHKHHQQVAQQGHAQSGQQHNNQWQQQAGQSAPSSLQQQYQTAAIAAAAVVPAAFDHGPASTIRQQQIVKEPIFPVDNSKIRYNALGQPYEEIPNHMIQRHTFPLPQTLSPIPPPVKPMKFGTVKSTLSKTSLIGTETVGKQPSKSQLQQIYREYRGSNSYPNLGGSVTPLREKTCQPLTPLENVGDLANAKKITIKLEQIDGDGGDGLVMTKKITEDDDVITPLRSARRRNGLQDVETTRYSNNKSPKWSFHGDTHSRSFYTTHRLKPKNL